MWKREGVSFGLPDISCVEYLLEWLGPSGVGLCQSGDMGGLNPISWVEIDAFSRATGNQLEAWEAQQLRLCSVAYVSGYNLGQKPMRVSPVYEDRPDEDPGIALERRRVSEQLKAAMRG